jgi:hypothetical protein
MLVMVGPRGSSRAERIIVQPRRLLPLVALLFVIAAATLSRFAARVPAVDAVGLSGGGFALGVGFAFLVCALTRRTAPVR